jgi:hypothetical protein
MQSDVRIKLLSASDEGTGLSILPTRERKQGLCSALEENASSKRLNRYKTPHQVKKKYG